MSSYWLYWVCGFAIVALAIIVGVFFVVWRKSRAAESQVVDLPLWDAEEHLQRDFWPELVDKHDETMPAVLTPPEWRTPKSGTDHR